MFCMLHFCAAGSAAVCDGAGASAPQHCSGCSVENQGPNSIICVCFVTLLALRGARSSPCPAPCARCHSLLLSQEDQQPVLAAPRLSRCPCHLSAPWLRRSWSSAEGPSCPVAVPWLCWEGTAVLPSPVLSVCPASLGSLPFPVQSWGAPGAPSPAQPLAGLRAGLPSLPTLPELLQLCPSR